MTWSPDEEAHAFCRLFVAAYAGTHDMERAMALVLQAHAAGLRKPDKAGIEIALAARPPSPRQQRLSAAAARWRWVAEEVAARAGVTVEALLDRKGPKLARWEVMHRLMQLGAGARVAAALVGSSNHTAVLYGVKRYRAVLAARGGSQLVVMSGGRRAARG